jgi:hypothetical protein
MQLHEDPFICYRVISWRQTDGQINMQKLVCVYFCNFPCQAPKCMKQIGDSISECSIKKLVTLVHKLNILGILNAYTCQSNIVNFKCILYRAYPPPPQIWVFNRTVKENRCFPAGNFAVPKQMQCVSQKHSDLHYDIRYLATRWRTCFSFCLHTVTFGTKWLDTHITACL